MTEKQILKIIQDEVAYFKWDFNSCMEALKELKFTVESVVGNTLFDESKIRNTVAMAYHAFGS